LRLYHAPVELDDKPNSRINTNSWIQFIVFSSFFLCCCVFSWNIDLNVSFIRFHQQLFIQNHHFPLSTFKKSFVILSRILYTILRRFSLTGDLRRLYHVYRKKICQLCYSLSYSTNHSFYFLLENRKHIVIFIFILCYF
jgi:hypothetical protein